MKQLEKSVKDIMVAVDHVEKTSEGQLKGGFAIIGGNDPTSPQGTNVFFCKENSGNCVEGCGGPTSSSKANSLGSGIPLSF